MFEHFYSLCGKNSMKLANGIIYAVIGIIFSMILLPITTMHGLDHSLPVWIGIYLYIIWMVSKGMPGYSVILLAIAMCQPNVSSDEVDFLIGLSFTRHYYYSLFILPVIVLIINIIV